jgi:soluble lytic murein transglycosylase-like protein
MKYMALVLSFLLLPSPARASEIPVDRATAVFLMQKVSAYYSVDFETLSRIIQCESSWNAHAESRTGDTGLLQVNRKFHKQTAKQRGYDIENWQAAAEYGVLLFKEQGPQPWKASAHCHGLASKPKKVA